MLRVADARFTGGNFPIIIFPVRSFLALCFDGISLIFQRFFLRLGGGVVGHIFDGFRTIFRGVLDLVRLFALACSHAKAQRRDSRQDDSFFHHVSLCRFAANQNDVEPMSKRTVGSKAIGRAIQYVLLGAFRMAGLCPLHSYEV